DFIITPRLINQLKLGYLYDNTQYAPGVKPSYATLPTVAWAFGNSTGTMSGQSYPLPITTFYPILNASDSVTWEKGSHAISFGASWYREQDHYYNPPEGFPNYSLGLASGDPALNAFNTSNFPGASANDLEEAEQLYAILTGRISNVNGQFAKNPHDNTYQTGVGAYNLDEVSSAAGLFAEDSWKVRRDLTLNYGLRWDFVGDQHDLTGAYHSSSPGDIYGPSGYGNLFNPGSLKGNMSPVITANEHAYAPWKVTPQPAFGFSWNPTVSDGPLGALLGGSSTVIRGGFALRRFTEPYQYYWNQASDYGSFFYQNFSLNPNNTGTAGTFAPGSLSLGQTLPPYAISPATYETTSQQAEFTFIGGAPGVNGIDPHIKQPYSESWNFGVQRALGSSRVLEVRYNGNRSIHQWIAINPNEVNVFENGFLAEFKKAQANLAANGGPNAANPSFAGSGMPIITAAFGGSASDSDFSNGQFIQYLVNGDVGSFANTLSGVNGTHPYFCNLVGSKFAPCVTNAGVTTAGAGYPINFFQANPYAAGTQTGYMTAAGYSNYNALQVEFRQASWKGLQFDANYTYSKSLGISTPQSWTGSLNVFTLRNLRQSYGPSQFDLTHVTHIHGTYDLPFGHGKSFLSNNAIADKVVGGWTVGTILSFQTGYPFALTGGNQTFNDYGDGGVTLSRVTSGQLQKSIGVHRIPGQTFVALIDPKYLASATGGGANATYISPNTTPGTIGRVVYLHGPHGFYDDISVTKIVPIRREMNFRIQAEFLNAFNHPVFGNSSSQTGAAGSINSSVQSNSFGLGGISNSSRLIELRGNIDF
ncbi:MAG: carboxypeptidase regulatory-like domain-containing protein, partial [Edaphobacter sp.]